MLATVTEARTSSADTLFVVVLALFAVTFVHHLYGGIIYKTKWRIDGSLVFAFVGMPLLVLLHWWGQSSQGAWYAYLLYVIIMWGVLIGLFEGGYNHLLKVILWAGKAPQSLLERLFPPKEYVLPNNFYFEASGILSLFLGVWVLVLAVPKLL